MTKQEIKSTKTHSKAPSPINRQKKLEDLQKKILNLQEEQKTIQQEMAQDLVHLLEELETSHIPQDILIGGLLHIINAHKNNFSEIGGWQKEGATFLKRRAKTKLKAQDENPQSSGQTKAAT